MQFLQIWLTKLQQKGCQVKLFALTYIHKKCMSISFILNENLLFRVILLYDREKCVILASNGLALNHERTRQLKKL